MLLQPAFNLLLFFWAPWQIGADEGSTNRTCFWSTAARFERFWSLSDYERITNLKSLEGAALRTDSDLGFRHIYFVVRASQDRAEYAIRMERTWMHAAANRVYLVDGLIPDLPLNCQVVMNDAHTLQGSQDPVAISRLMIWMNQVRYSYGVGDLPPETRWIVILGDDVYVNLARLYYFLAQHASTDGHPVLFSHVLSDAEVYDFDMPCMADGAIILSRAALDLLSQHTSCKACPYVASDSISIAYCAIYNSIPLVHVPSIHCYPKTMGDSGKVLSASITSHQWIAAGGLSKSDLGAVTDGLRRDQLLAHHPFEDDFPNLDCNLPSGTRSWSYQQLFERTRFCLRQPPLPSGHPLASQRNSGPPPTLQDGEVLSAESIDDYFEARWPGNTVSGLLEDIVFASHPTGWRQIRAALVRRFYQIDEFDVDVTLDYQNASQWYFLRPANTWLHDTEVHNFLESLKASDLLRSSTNQLVFAFVRSAGRSSDAQIVDFRAGLIISLAAAWALVEKPGPPGDAHELLASVLEDLGITLVHTPLLVPVAAALPRSLTGLITEGAVSGVWSVGEVDRKEVLEDLEFKAEDRRFFAGLLEENFEDLARASQGQACGAERDETAQRTVESAKRWMRFLHNDDEHIKVVRGFQGGRREFRTLHAMYRSEAAEAFPSDGASVDTLLVARDCANAAE